MKIYAVVSRGPQKGETVTPHLHDDGKYVVSPTPFERDHVRAATLEGFASKIRKGVKGRFYFPIAKGPRLFSQSSIYIEG